MEVISLVSYVGTKWATYHVEDLDGDESTIDPDMKELGKGFY